MTGRGSRPHKAPGEAIPIAKARGLIQVAIGGTERIYDLSIVSKIPIVFASVMFAPKILAGIPELADYYRNDPARLRVIARDAAITIELWIRPGTARGVSSRSRHHRSWRSTRTGNGSGPVSQSGTWPGLQHGSTAEG